MAKCENNFISHVKIKSKYSCIVVHLVMTDNKLNTFVEIKMVLLCL